MPWSITLTIACRTEGKIRAPPGRPSASAGRPSRSTIVRRHRAGHALAGRDRERVAGVRIEEAMCCSAACRCPGTMTRRAEQAVDGLRRRDDVAVAVGHGDSGSCAPSSDAADAGGRQAWARARMSIRAAALVRVVLGDQPRDRHVDEGRIGRSPPRGRRRRSSAPRPAGGCRRRCRSPAARRRSPPGCSASGQMACRPRMAAAGR